MSSKKDNISLSEAPGLPKELRLAEETAGKLRRGAVLVCGGMGGVMEAACRAPARLEESR